MISQPPISISPTEKQREILNAKRREKYKTLTKEQKRARAGHRPYALLSDEQKKNKRQRNREWMRAWYRKHPEEARQGLSPTIENIRPSALRRLQNGRLEIEIELRPVISVLRPSAGRGLKSSHIGIVDTRQLFSTG